MSCLSLPRIYESIQLEKCVWVDSLKVENLQCHQATQKIAKLTKQAIVIECNETEANTQQCERVPGGKYLIDLGQGMK